MRVNRAKKSTLILTYVLYYADTFARMLRDFCVKVCRVREGHFAGAVSFPISLPSCEGFDLSAARSKALSSY